MKQHYVWLIWSSSTLVPWTVPYFFNAGLRSVLWRASVATGLFGVTEPLTLPAYWNPPSLFDLAQRTCISRIRLIRVGRSRAPHLEGQRVMLPTQLVCQRSHR